MKKTEINFTITLDDNNVPEKIDWEATDNPYEQLTETKTISINLWDHQHKNTLRIDLWTKDLQVDEMKRFAIDCIGGLGQTLLTATGDEFMSKEINELCDRLVDHVKKEEKK